MTNYQQVREQFDRVVADAIRNYPDKSYRLIAKELGIGVDWVMAVAKTNNLNRKRGRKPKTEVAQ